MKTTTNMHSRFRTRLFTGIVFILTPLTLAVSLLFSFVSMKNTIRTEQISNRILLERISSQIDSLYGQMNIAATSITKNPTLKQIILDLNIMDPSESESYTELLQQERTIQTILGNMMFSPTISNVLLYNREKEYFYYTGTYLGNTARIAHTLSDYDESEASAQSYPVYTEPMQSPWLDSDWKVISVMRNFSDNRTTQDTIVEIQVPAHQLNDICTQSAFQDEKEILIQEPDGSLIYPYDTAPSVLTEKQNQSVLEKVQNGVDSEYHFSYSYLTSVSQETGYHITLVSNNATIHQQIFTYFIISLTTACFILAAMLLIVYKVLAMVTKPLNQLIGYVGQISLDDETKLELPSNSLDEFEILNTSMTQMVANLKNSIHKIYELQLRESNANLAALQAQIDPHFMYNALNSISAASEIYGSEMTTRMCQQFSSMMRYVTSGKQTVPLIEELNHTETYLEFMSLSNEDNFSYSIDADPMLNSLPVPKLSIQPLVENCFKHGFCTVAPPWQISIRSMKNEDGYWVIEVEDNGGGFSEEAICKTMSLPLSFNALEINGLGLNNTFSRFSIHFHGDFTYQITNLHPGSKIILKGAFPKC